MSTCGLIGHIYTLLYSALSYTWLLHWSTLFHSLGGNAISDEGAIVLAFVVRVNQNLKALE